MRQANFKSNITTCTFVLIFGLLLVAAPAYGFTLEEGTEDVTLNSFVVTTTEGKENNENTALDNNIVTTTENNESNLENITLVNPGTSTGSGTTTTVNLSFETATDTSSTTSLTTTSLTTTSLTTTSSAIIISELEINTSTSSTVALPIETPVGGQSGESTQTIAQPQTMSQVQLSDAIDKILNYFKTQQSLDGKIIDGTITDWAIMSFGANDQYAEEIKNTTTSLLDYEKKYNLDDPSDINSCATYPRHILALLAAGVSANDSSIQGLKEKMLTVCYKDNLYGLNGTNDDVFALLAFLATGESTQSPLVISAVNTIVSDQTADGSFTWAGYQSADITGASINALKYAQNKGAEIDNEIFTKAKSYLKSTQQTDGGWGYGTSDVMTTSWVLMGINALGEGQNDWFTASGTNPWYPLVNQLKTEGYYEPSWAPGTTDWFAMKHAVPALAGKSWPIILPEKVQNFSQGATFTYGSSSGYTPPIVTPTNTLATTTVVSTITSTSTLIATTTTTTTTVEIVKDNTTTTTKLTASKERISAPLVDTRQTLDTKNARPTKTEKMVNNSTNTTPQTLSSGAAQNDTAINVINQLPIDTSHKNSVKKVLAVSGGSAAALGLYLGLRLIKNVI